MIDSYSKLPLGMYLDIRALQEDPAIDETDLRVKVCALLAGKTEREVLNAPISESAAWFRGMAFLSDEAPIARRIADAYQVGGFDLVPTTDLRKLTTAQYFDFQAFAPGGEAKLPELLAAFLVPRGKTYGDGYDVVEVQQAIRDALPVTDVLALSAFFLSKYAALIRATRCSLATMSRTEKIPQRKALIREMLANLEKTVLTFSRLAGGGSTALTE